MKRKIARTAQNPAELTTQKITAIFRYHLNILHNVK